MRIATLPVELLQQTFAHLEPTDMRRASQVNRTWRASAEWPLSKALSADLQPPEGRRWTYAQATSERLERHHLDGNHGAAPSYVLPKVRPGSFTDPARRQNFCTRPDGVYVRSVAGWERITFPSLFDLSSPPERRAIAVSRSAALAPFALAHGVLVANHNTLVLTTATGEVRRQRVGSPLCDAMPSHDGHRVATAHEDGVRVWRLPALTLDAYLPPANSFFETDVSSIRWAANDSYLAAMGPTYAVNWHVPTGHQQYAYPHYACRDAHFDANGHLLVVGGGGTDVLDGDSAALSRFFYTYADATLVGPGGRALLNTRNEWPKNAVTERVHLPSGVAVGRPFQHRMTVAQTTLSADARWFVALGEDGRVETWDLLQRGPITIRLNGVGRPIHWPRWFRSLLHKGARPPSELDAKATDEAAHIWETLRSVFQPLQGFEPSLWRAQVQSPAQRMLNYLQRYHNPGDQQAIRALFAPMNADDGDMFSAGLLCGVIIEVTLRLAKFYTKCDGDAVRATALVRDVCTCLPDIPRLQPYRAELARTLGVANAQDDPRYYVSTVKSSFGALKAISSEERLPLNSFRAGVSWNGVSHLPLYEAGSGKLRTPPRQR